RAAGCCHGPRSAVRRTAPFSIPDGEVTSRPAGRLVVLASARALCRAPATGVLRVRRDGALYVARGRQVGGTDHRVEITARLPILGEHVAVAPVAVLEVKQIAGRPYVIDDGLPVGI